METKAKTYRGYLNACIVKAKDNPEMLIFLREMLATFNTYYPQKIIKNEIEIVDGWKGEGSMEIYRGFENDFTIIEHIKEKHSGEVKPRYSTVKKEDLNKILFIIKDMDLHVNYKCYYFAKKLNYESWKELWKERKEYFRVYYRPIKIAEALGIIKYGGRGTITRIK